MLTTAFRPELTGGYVRRPRLYPLLGRPGARLTLVAGLPGAGKTALVREWLDTVDARPVWVSFDGSGPVRSGQFWGSVLDGLDLGDDRRVKAVSAALTGTGPAAGEFLGGIADRVRSARESVVLVLDGYEAVTGDATHRLVGRFLDHCPANLSVVITTRRDPPLPLGRWRVRGELAEVGETDLHLNLAEVRALTAELGERAAVRLLERTEGWATGVGLALRAARDTPDPVAFLHRFDGTEEHIAGYLLREGWHSQPEAVQRFLTSTAALEPFSAPLCDAVMRGSDGAARLAALSAQHLFILPVEGAGRWFRYHRLFRDVLTSKLNGSRSRARSIATRAARWHAEFGEPEATIGYALAGRDYDLAVRQLIDHHVELSAAGRWSVVLDSLNRVPPSFVARSRRHVLDHAWVLAVNGLPERAEALADHLSSAAPDRGRATVAVIRALTASANGDIDGFLALSDLIGEVLPEDHPAASAWLLTRTWVFGLAGGFQDADAGFAAVARRAGWSGSVARGLRAEILVRQGRLREAAVEIHSFRTTWSADALHPASGSALRAEAGLRLEAGRFDEAEECLWQAERVDHQAAMPMQAALTAIGLAEVEQARGRPDRALGHLDAVLGARYSRSPGRLFRGYLAEARARAHLDAGDLAAAARDLSEVMLPGAAAVLRARLALAEGDYRAALELKAFTSQSVRYRVEAHLIVARALLGSYQPGARDELKQALGLGTEEGFLRMVLAEPELAALDGAMTDGHPPEIGFDPTERELDVLRLLAKDLSYREIAAELFLSLNTVKAHARSLYRKLDVHGRADAARRAVDLGLLD